MADFSKFRSTLGGFNRADVSEYIEKISMEHQTAMQQSREEAVCLQSQLDAAREALERKEAENASLQAQLDEKDALLETLTAPTAPQEPEEAPPDYPSLELEAYRRAEATERLAAERAARLRLQVDELLDNVSTRYEQTGQDIKALTEDIRTNLQRLEDTLSDLDLVFDETTHAFSSLDGGMVMAAV